ncbi:hypothetical protein L1994_11225 [Methanomicrobium antiquum]|uniref:Uncharacterized protein n=1 Tax=Methanomicrobium antiquum TaxID=487686 RepID=A0AAF0FQG6_9EURY|nr:hypothetical protein [Methanomicrobium antiquum]WFN36692.1 hypothetical protein L1994_11225 [Methanomicrobium antiquum]
MKRNKRFLGIKILIIFYIAAAVLFFPAQSAAPADSEFKTDEENKTYAENNTDAVNKTDAAAQVNNEAPGWAGGSMELAGQKDMSAYNPVYTPPPLKKIDKETAKLYPGLVVLDSDINFSKADNYIVRNISMESVTIEFINPASEAESKEILRAYAEPIASAENAGVSQKSLGFGVFETIAAAFFFGIFISLKHRRN